MITIIRCINELKRTAKGFENHTVKHLHLFPNGMSLHLFSAFPRFKHRAGEQRKSDEDTSDAYSLVLHN